MAEIINKEHKNVPPDKLREHPANPRQGDVGAIYESIKENGFYGTIVVQKSTGYVLAGNHRLKAAKEVGLDTVPVVYVDVDDERAMRILLADNRTNDLATYDDTALIQLLEHLASTDDGLAGTGYDGDYLDDLLRGLSIPEHEGWGDVFAAMPDEDNPPFMSMNFTVHDSQVEIIREALKNANKTSDVNENSNGNALTNICTEWLQLKI